MSLEDDADEVFLNLARFRDNVGILEVAEEAIRNSAYWYGHPHGPAKSPKHADRLTDGRRGWEMEFGANKFLVEVAIRRCIARIENAAITAVETGSPTDEAQLRRDLEFDVTGSVANYDDEEYPGHYDASDGYMHFGTQAIHVGSFVSTICDRAAAYLITQSPQPD